MAYFLWRSNLLDEGDNHVLELAVAGGGGADVIITANKRDFRRSDLRFPSIGIENAEEILDGSKAMGTLTIRLPNDQHERLKTLAPHRGLSLDRRFEEFSVEAPTEFDVETRFRIKAASGNPDAGAAILYELDARCG